MLHNNLDQIIHSYHENRLSHAFLIETNDQEQCLKEIKKIIKHINCEHDYKEKCSDCNLCHLIDTEQLPSLEIIRPDGQNVKKEQVLEMKKKFSTKPIFSKYNVYIILNSEKFNASSANTILKFVEEPEEGLIGFFLTNNKENIINTIKSRCQIISAFYENDKNEIDFEQLAIQYLKQVHESKDTSLLINREFFLQEDFIKESYQQFFQTIFNIYYDLYQASLNIQVLLEKYLNLKFLLKNEPAFFLKQLKIVEQLETELGYNVNMNLLLDRFVLETRT